MALFAPDLVIFDLDGTLVDTSPGIYDTARFSMKEVGLDPDVPEERMRKFVGPPLRECYRVTYGLDAETVDRLHLTEIYQKRYRSVGQYEGKVYDGIPEVLETLRNRGKKLAVGTLKNTSVSKTLLAHFDLAKWFTIILGDLDEGGRTKADVLDLVMKEAGVGREKALLVGDTPHDENGAREAGLPFLPVTYGFGFKPGEKNPAAGTARDILSFIV